MPISINLVNNGDTGLAARNKINDAIKELNDAGTADSLALLNADGNIDINNLPSKLLTTDDKGVADGVASLDGNTKIPAAQLPNSILEYKGTWDADTNTTDKGETLSDGDATNAGNVYRVSVAGTTNFGNGSISFEVGDYCIANEDGTWEKSDTTDAVSSVAGKTGDVTLALADLSNYSESSLVSGDIVQYDGSGYVNQALGNINLSSFNQDISDITDLSSHSATELNDITSAGSGAIITSSERTTINNALTSIPTLQQVTDEGNSTTTGMSLGGNLTVSDAEGIKISDPTKADGVSTYKPNVDVTGLSPGITTEAAIIEGRKFGHFFIDIFGNADDDAFAVRTSSNDDGVIDTISFLVRNDGKVGIGKTTGLQGLLDVAGDVYSTKGVLTSNEIIDSSSEPTSGMSEGDVWVDSSTNSLKGVYYNGNWMTV